VIVAWGRSKRARGHRARGGCLPAHGRPMKIGMRLADVRDGKLRFWAPTGGSSC